VGGDTITGVEGNIFIIHPKMRAHIILSKVNVRQGQIKYGDKGIQAVLEEL